MAKKPIHVLSVGGSIIIPKTGFDIAFLRAFRAMILKEIKKGHRFLLVVGGGATSRTYQAAAMGVKDMTARDLDLIGIEATMLNATLLHHLFAGVVQKTILRDPYIKHSLSKPLTIAAGYKPGNSTDWVAVQLAKTYGSTSVINLSNISHVYTKDPNLHADAEPIARMDWKSFRSSFTPQTWTPGLSAPFDPIASREAEKMGCTVAVVLGTDLTQVSKAINQKPFAGTLIVPTQK